MVITPAMITGIILAGGRGRRMGGIDKGLVEFAGRPLIEHVIEVLSPQVGSLMINANRNQDAYAAYGYPVITDKLGDYQGPLAGFSSAMQAASTDYIVTVPCDGPLLSSELVERLTQALQDNDAEIAVAHDGERLQPVYALLPTRLLNNLQEFLDSGDRKIDRWYAWHSMALADCSDIPGMFRNINTPAERDQLQQEKLA
ncbi:MAG: molybdenum cofactor guanylyltransferase [Proteobacteria bacterium]|jgi:molybdenum cofactor guanylyltransferase|nr:molybdenum cofactor guanylyltransferase [Pseudomonadota bacterium]MCG6935097.1 molybdenum cofactor guanylyltransferase [Pseudomonadota bacterium]